MTSLKLNYTKQFLLHFTQMSIQKSWKWLFHVSVKYRKHFKRIWFIIQGLSQHPRQYELSSVNIWNEDIIKKSFDCAWPDKRVHVTFSYYSGFILSGVQTRRGGGQTR